VRYLTNIDLNGNQLLNAKIQNLASAPASPTEGLIYHNTTDHNTYVYSGTAWVSLEAVTTLAGTSPVTVTNNGNNSYTISVAAATESAAGLLSSADKTTIDNLPSNLALKAPLASPNFTVSVGNPVKITTGVTKAAGLNTNEAFRIQSSDNQALFQVMQNGDTVIGGILTVNGTGTSTFAGDVNIAGNLTVQHNATAQAQLAANNFEVTGDLKVDGNSILGSADDTHTTNIYGVTTIHSGIPIGTGSSSVAAFAVMDNSATPQPLFQVMQNGDTVVGGILHVSGTGTSTFNGDVSIAGKLSVAQSSTVTGTMSGSDLTISGNLVVQGNTTLGDQSTDVLTVQGQVTLPSTTTIGTVTPTELSYVHGVTSSIQTQLGASNLLTQIKTVDGSGSGLDADLLDGNNGTWYQARANHTGTQTASTISDFNTAVQTNTLNSLAVPTSSVSMNSHTITNLADPVNPQDAATKNYVDGVAQGLDIKQSVRVVSTTNVAIATGGLLTIDGVTLVAGNRVLLTGQTTGTENGIYVAASGAWTRASDSSTNAEVTSGMFTFVEEGSTHKSTGWVLQTANPITLGTTSLSFTQFSGAGTYLAGNGLSLSGGTFSVLSANTAHISVSSSGVDISSTYAGQNTITTLGTVTTGTWNATAVAVAYGGTGATTASAARANLGATTKYSQTVGDGSSTSITVTHNLNTSDVIVQVRDASTNVQVYCDVTNASVNTITLAFSSAPASNAYRVVVIG
jgi:cytoskeletal protein CcmA (bactofilin family)